MSKRTSTCPYGHPLSRGSCPTCAGIAATAGNEARPYTDPAATYPIARSFQVQRAAGVARSSGSGGSE
jgi:hypothetical protein